jgi:Spy/CpxP family protein refolding chaperone
MFGIILGTLCLLALIGTVRHRHGYAGHCGAAHAGHMHAYGRGYMRAAYNHGDGCDPEPRGFRFRGMRYALDLNDAQTDALREVEHSLLAARDRSKDRIDSTREALAEALRADSFNTDAVNDGLDRVVQSFDDGRKAIVNAIAKAHETLRPEQRKRLARFIAR